MDMNKLVKLIIAELSNKELESYLSDSQKEYIASKSNLSEKAIESVLENIGAKRVASYYGDELLHHISIETVAAFHGDSLIEYIDMPKPEVDDVLENYSLGDVLDNYSRADVLDFYDISDVIDHCLMGGCLSDVLDSVLREMTAEDIASELESHFHQDPETFKDLVKYLIDYL
jgi:hypothetical protein